MNTRTRYALMALLLSALTTQAQDFPKGWFVPFELGQGFVRLTGGPELWLANVQIAPQVTVVEGKLRAGASAGGFYTNGRLGGLLGPRVTIKLTQGKPIFGGATSYNINLTGEFLWGTDNRQLPGIGLAFESSNVVAIALKAHRDIRQEATWFQLSLAFNPFKKKIPEL